MDMKKMGRTREWLRRLLCGGVAGLGIALSLGSDDLWAATATASASVFANVATRTVMTLDRDDNSVKTRGSATQVLFDRYDDQDPGVVEPNAGFMYAPYRSETGKNWHLAQILANGSSMTLTAGVTGTAGSTPIADVLFVFTGGFFEPGGSTPIAGTKSIDWERLSTFTRTLNRPFIGTAPFNYRLSVSGIPGGTYAGNVTFTLTSN